MKPSVMVDIETIHVYPRETLTVFLHRNDRGEALNSIQVELRVQPDRKAELFCDDLNSQGFPEWSEMKEMNVTNLNEIAPADKVAEEDHWKISFQRTDDKTWCNVQIQEFEFYLTCAHSYRAKESLLEDIREDVRSTLVGEAAWEQWTAGGLIRIYGSRKEER